MKLRMAVYKMHNPADPTADTHSLMLTTGPPSFKHVVRYDWDPAYEMTEDEFFCRMKYMVKELRRISGEE